MLHLFSIFCFRSTEVLSFLTSFKPASEQSLDNFWSSDNCSNFRSYSCTRFLRCCALVEFSAIERSVGSSIFSKWSGAAGFPGALTPLGTSLHKSVFALLILSWFAEITVRGSNSLFSWLPLKCIDFLPPPLLRNSPLSKALEARNNGWPDPEKFATISSAIRSHDPSGLSV